MLRQQIIEKKVITHYESQVEVKILVVLFWLKLSVVLCEQNMLHKARSATKHSVRCTEFY